MGWAGNPPGGHERHGGAARGVRPRAAAGDVRTLAPALGACQGGIEAGRARVSVVILHAAGVVEEEEVHVGRRERLQHHGEEGFSHVSGA